MKKTKLLSLLSALLCVVMLLASCNDPGAGGDGGDGGDGYGRPTIDVLSADWFEYLQYNTENTVEDYDSAVSAFLNVSSANAVIQDTSTNDPLVYITEYKFGDNRVGKYEDLTPEITDDNEFQFIGYETTISYTFKVVNVYTGATVWTKSANTTGIVSTNGYADRADIVSYKPLTTMYGFQTYGTTGFFQISTRTNVTPAPTTEVPNPTPEFKTTYALYDSDGNQLAAADELIEVDVNYNNEVIVGTDKYIVKDTKVVKKVSIYDVIVELPVDIEHGDYKYAYFEGKESDVDGDGIRSTELFVQVFDNSYKLVFEKVFYFSDYYDVFVLPNGNVLVTLDSEVDDDAAEYDFVVYEGSDEDIKYVQDTYLLTPAGEVTELELPYIVADVKNSVGDHTYTVKDDNNLVYAYTTTDSKALNLTYSFYIVDNTFATVKELSPMFAGQQDIDYLSTDSFIVNVYGGMNTFNYRVTKYSSTASLYASHDSEQTILPNGSIFYQPGDSLGILYSRELSVIKDFNETDHDSVVFYENLGVFVGTTENSEGNDSYTFYHYDFAGSYVSSNTLTAQIDLDVLWDDEIFTVSYESGGTVSYHIYNKYGLSIWSATAANCVSGMPYVSSTTYENDTVYTISYFDADGIAHTVYFK